MKTMRTWLLIIALVGFISKAKAVPTTNGLYAVIATTKGTFYCFLNYGLAPRTVANFVGLANGTKDWLDYSKATVGQRPFYNGLTFHRVVKNFVIQAGSPNGQGNDDPGYTFRNEIVASLKHNKPGMLAMANAGTTNSNGSQFYVTMAARPDLDGKYTVFGHVVEGMNVVSNINSVAVDSGSHPLVPVLITNLTILRIGTAANNFNAAAVSPALPVPRVKEAVIRFAKPQMYLDWYKLPNNEYRVFVTGDMQNWDIDRDFFGNSLIFTGSSDDVTFYWSFYSYVFFRVVESKID